MTTLELEVVLAKNILTLNALQMNENSLKFNSKYFKVKMAIWQAQASLGLFTQLGFLNPSLKGI